MSPARKRTLLATAAILAVAMLSSANDHAYAQTGDAYVQNRFGDAAEQQLHGIDTGRIAPYETWIAGEFEGTLQFGGSTLVSAGGSDAYVAKIGDYLTPIWGLRFGDGGAQAATDVASDFSGNATIVGVFEGTIDLGGGPLVSGGGADIFVAKFQNPGGYIWGKRFGDAANQTVSAVDSDTTNGVVIVGTFAGSVDFGDGTLTSAGGTDIFVARFNALGNHVWSKRFGDAADQRAADVVLDGSDRVFIIGSFAGTLDLGGGPLTSAGADDLFVARLDSDGNHVWSQRFGDTSNQTGRSIDVPRSLVPNQLPVDVTFAGDFEGSVDFGGGPLTSAGGTDAFMARLDADGMHEMSRRFGDGADQSATSVISIGLGQTWLAGMFSGGIDLGAGSMLSAGPTDMFIARFDSTDGHIWSERYGDGTDASPPYIARGQFKVGGSFEGVIDPGLGPMTSAGASDVFVAHLGAGGYVERTIPAATGGSLSNGANIIPITVIAEADVPPGAAASDFLLTISGSVATNPPPGFDIPGPGPTLEYVFHPEGMNFTQPVTLRFKIGTFSVGALPPSQVVLTRDGMVVPDCSGPPVYPCVSARTTIPFGLQIEALTDEFSGTWGIVVANTDGDSCTDFEELGTSQLLGGQRDPNNPWDFYDIVGQSLLTPPDGKVNALDIALVRSEFNQDYPPYDRSPGAHPWAPGPPDGIVNGIDIGLVRASFNHSCQAPP